MDPSPTPSQDPKLWPSAVQELCRFHTASAYALRRVALEDVKVLRYWWGSRLRLAVGGSANSPAVVPNQGTFRGWVTLAGDTCSVPLYTMDALGSMTLRLAGRCLCRCSAPAWPRRFAHSAWVPLTKE